MCERMCILDLYSSAISVDVVSWSLLQYNYNLDRLHYTYYKIISPRASLINPEGHEGPHRPTA